MHRSPLFYACRCQDRHILICFGKLRWSLAIEPETVFALYRPEIPRVELSSLYPDARGRPRGNIFATSVNLSCRGVELKRHGINSCYHASAEAAPPEAGLSRVRRLGDTVDV